MELQSRCYSFVRLPKLLGLLGAVKMRNLINLYLFMAVGLQGMLQV